MERWRGRVALVTGASAGIGAGICRELVKQGMVVVGCARNVEKIKAIAEEEEVRTAAGRLIAIKCDLTKESEILSMFQEIRQKFDRVDVCINNAGMSHDAPLLTGDTNQWRQILEVNVLALCICSRESIKLMKEKEIDDGQIIHISSIGGHRLPNFPLAGVHFYCGTKHMVRALTEGLRREVKTLNKNIRVGVSISSPPQNYNFVEEKSVTYFRFKNFGRNLKMVEETLSLYLYFIYLFIEMCNFSV
ncbi:dehydrogenase/reductase SDR family member 11-like [Stegodyphus dumicola]|uniref:dehydrogenase/reductase SDR family member 11-like n=1 Tax=Stegodyphus dumicola TaxID=202533 RepID=UPI0015AD2FF7|nr:dehydrogenase/reductase SDR family member 11-like [Stegodyphus dumicola]